MYGHHMREVPGMQLGLYPEVRKKPTSLNIYMEIHIHLCICDQNKDGITLNIIQKAQRVERKKILREIWHFPLTYEQHTRRSTRIADIGERR